MNMPAELIGISYSPWTEKAKWALDHHRVPYSYREHLLMLGMPALRAHTGRWRGEITVPLLLDGKQRCWDSFEIARYAEQRGQASNTASLFPPGMQEKITELNILSEEGLDAGRSVILGRMAKDPEARRENIPTFVPRPLKLLMVPIVSLGMNYVAREFNIDPGAAAKNLERLDSVLERVSDVLRRSGGTYFLGQFSYADIALAVVLQFVNPVENDYVRIGPGVRRCWTDVELSRKFDYLVKWRNNLYERHRRNANH